MSIFNFFYGEYENEKKTGQKNLTFPNEDLNLWFLSKFPPKIWILREIRSIEVTVLKKSWLYGGYSFRTNLVSFRTFRCCLFPNPVTGHELFFAVSYSKAALVYTYYLNFLTDNHYTFCTLPWTDLSLSRNLFWIKTSKSKR